MSKGRKPANLQGREFNRLTAIRRKDEKKNKCYIWECMCACGKKIEVDAGGLTRGDIQSCGCLLKNRNKEMAKVAQGRKEKILKMIKEEGLSQSQVAERLGVSRQMISKILRRI